jgi:tellurite resistance protein TehA-like permease
MTTQIVDEACAWLLLSHGAFMIVMIEIWHRPPAVLDLPSWWILLAMLNLLRIRNDVNVRHLKSFCRAANLIVLTPEA